jgi:hypothetical protein
MPAAASLSCQIGIVIKVNGSAEFHGLFRAGGLLAVVATERLSRLAS